MSHSKPQIRGEALAEQVAIQAAMEVVVKVRGSGQKRPITLTCGVGWGEGGHGGSGDMKGGNEGVGELPSHTEPLLPPRTQLPAMTVKTFCEEYNLDSRIASILDDQGFKTVGVLSTVLSIQLQDVGLGIEDIAELKAALETLASRGTQ
ncbi:hypothetical protein B0H11DRAFT_2223598 [Mycena galericulata]|nr:hypothetical protein B0H11DRAFT_2223598 [Mycena galericulata]